MEHPVKVEYDKLERQLQISRNNLQEASNLIHNLSKTDNKYLFVDNSMKLAELSGRQMFLEKALDQQRYDRTDNEIDAEFGFISWAIAGGALAALSLGGWIYHQYSETKQFKEKMECYHRLRKDKIPAQQAAKECFGKGGLLAMIGLDTKTLALIGGAFILSYWLLTRTD